MQKFLKIVVVQTVVFAATFGGARDGFCRFDADWGVSSDTGTPGHTQIAQWLVDNNYYDDYNDARLFAETGYKGYNSGDADPFYWTFNVPVAVQIVGECAGNAGKNVLGYYSGNGNGMMLNPFALGVEKSGFAYVDDIDTSFGLYLNTPQHNIWFTDRAENTMQDGVLARLGGNPQALIYEIGQGYQWLIAWEDLDATLPGTDRDYNDMWVTVTAAPEPVGGMLFLLGGGALTAWKRRKRSYVDESSGTA